MANTPQTFPAMSDTEIAHMRAEVTDLIRTYIVCKAAADRGAFAVGPRARAAQTMARLVTIGDYLTIRLTACDSVLDRLIDRWTMHSYRPSLYGSANGPEMILADLYDIRAESRGIKVKAYRVIR